MSRWIYVVLHLRFEDQAARRDARVRFLMAQVEILRRKLGGKRVVPNSDDWARLLVIGQELDHKVLLLPRQLLPGSTSDGLREPERNSPGRRNGLWIDQLPITCGIVRDGGIRDPA
ncbi:MAG: hypothetical protein GY778_16475 [bacterium]|nr:hypothetical protein [bacterium]